MALTFDTGKAIRKLRERGMEQDLAEATVEVVDEAVGEVVTKEYFREYLDLRIEASESRLRAEMNRSLAIYSGVVIAAVSAIGAVIQIFGN